MSTDKDLDKAKASAMDDVKIKESRIPNFTVEKKAGVSKTAKAEAQPTGQKANDIDNIVSMPKLRVLRGGGAEIPEFGVKKSSIQQELDVSASKKVDKKFDANVGVDKDGVNASVGFSMSSSTEVKAGVAAKLDKEQVLAEVQAKGKDGKVPLDELSKVLLRQMGVKPEDIIGLGTDFTSATMIPTDENGWPLCHRQEVKSHPHAFVKLWKHHGAQNQAEHPQGYRHRQP